MNNRMDFKILYFKKIFDYIEEYPTIPKRGTTAFKGYRGKYNELLAELPSGKGLYIWIDPYSQKIYRYVGKSIAGFDNRFENYFFQEYSIFWETIHDESLTIPQILSYYPNWENKINSKSYRDKSGSKFVVYFEISHPIRTNIDEDIEELEKELIKYFDPPANSQKELSDGFLDDYAEFLCKELEIFISNEININW